MIRNMVSVRTVWVIEFDMGLTVKMFGFIVLFDLGFKLFDRLIAMSSNIPKNFYCQELTWSAAVAVIVSCVTTN